MNIGTILLLIFISLLIIGVIWLRREFEKPKTRKSTHQLEALYRQAMRSQDPKFIAYVIKWVRREWGEQKSFKLQNRYNRLVGGVSINYYDYEREREDQETYGYVFGKKITYGVPDFEEDNNE